VARQWCRRCRAGARDAGGAEAFRAGTCVGLELEQLEQVDVPGGHPWWPVIAPVTVVILYLLAVRPLRRH
jgi:hypothetical protein